MGTKQFIRAHQTRVKYFIYFILIFLHYFGLFLETLVIDMELECVNDL